MLRAPASSDPMHDHSHHHDHVSDRRLLFSVLLNVGLTVVEVVVGLISGSLSLVADAIHNFSDAGALLIAWFARRLSRKGADHHFSFGYRRAELIGAMINLTTLLVVGLYLLYEAVERLFDPQPVLALWVMVAAGVALAVDVFTALFLWGLSKGSLNVRAAFIHNVTDAMASLAVLLGALVIHVWGFLWIDPLLTLVIAGYVLASSFHMLKTTARILMEGTPPNIDTTAIANTINGLENVQSTHHLHVWDLDEHRRALEAHVVLSPDIDWARMDALRFEIKDRLAQDFEIVHSTLEFESSTGRCADGPDSGCHGNGCPNTPEDRSHPEHAHDHTHGHDHAHS